MQQSDNIVFDKLTTYDHEMVVFCNDNATGLRAIIAIHNTTLGPSLGGIRMWNYASDQEALTDVLRLSRGMTLKSSAAGLNLGGGKAVIIGDARTQKTEALLRRMGKFVNNLSGKYIAAEDVGMKESDMEYIRRETPHVTGLPAFAGGSGNPSPITAYGVYLGIKASLKHQTGSESLKDKRIIVQGTGSVGQGLIDLLAKEEAKIFVYDIYEPSLKAVVSKYPVIVISAEEVYTTAADVYAPCALGATLNPDTIPLLNCSIVAGAANNQLLDEVRDGQALVDRGILYAPDFVINAGGVINIIQEVEGVPYVKERALSMCDRIYDTTLAILKTADTDSITPHSAALKIAQARIDAIGRNRLFM